MCCYILQLNKQAAVWFSGESLRKEPCCLETDSSRLLTGELSACPPGTMLLLRLHHTCHIFALQNVHRNTAGARRVLKALINKKQFLLKSAGDELIYRPAVCLAQHTISMRGKSVKMAEWGQLLVYQSWTLHFAIKQESRRNGLKPDLQFFLCMCVWFKFTVNMHTHYSPIFFQFIMCWPVEIGKNNKLLSQFFLFLPNLVTNKLHRMLLWTYLTSAHVFFDI